MPIYEYVCQGCEARLEVKQRMSDPPLTTCERCGKSLTKVISAPGIMFKGRGWYVTDYSDKMKPPSEADGAKTGEASPTPEKNRPRRNRQIRRRPQHPPQIQPARPQERRAPPGHPGHPNLPAPRRPPSRPQLSRSNRPPTESTCNRCPTSRASFSRAPETAFCFSRSALPS